MISPEVPSTLPVRPIKSLMGIPNQKGTAGLWSNLNLATDSRDSLLTGTMTMNKQVKPPNLSTPHSTMGTVNPTGLNYSNATMNAGHSTQHTRATGFSALFTPPGTRSGSGVLSSAQSLRVISEFTISSYPRDTDQTQNIASGGHTSNADLKCPAYYLYLSAQTPFHWPFCGLAAWPF